MNQRLQTEQALQAGAKPASGLTRFLPSLTDAAFLLPFLINLFNPEGLGFLLGDGDTGWHVRAGQWMLANGRVPDRDFFTFTQNGQPWYAWEWGWELLFGWLYQHWGLAAVLLGCALIQGCTFALLYRLARWKSGNPVLAFGVTILAMGASSVHWFARPHLVSWLMVVVFVYLMERVAAGETKLLKWLPILMIPWTNLHGGFLAGLLIVGAYAAGELVQALTGPAAGERAESFGRARRYALTGLFCAAATFVNPYGYRLHLHLVEYFPGSLHFLHVAEYGSPSFQGPLAKYFEAMIVLAVVTAVWELSRKRFVVPILLLGWLHLALTSVRHIPLLAMVLAGPAAAMLAGVAERIEGADLTAWMRRAAGSLRRLGAELMPVEALPRIPIVSAGAVLALAGIIWARPATPVLGAEYDPETYPARAVEFLKDSGLLESVYTTDVWGGYLIYRLYPQVKVFTDGRTDFYDDEFTKRFLATLRGKWDWEESLNHYGVRTALVPVGSPLASILKESARWRLVYDDGVATVFQRSGEPAGANRIAAGTIGGSSAIARSRSNNPVISGSQSYARR